MAKYYWILRVNAKGDLVPPACGLEFFTKEHITEVLEVYREQWPRSEFVVCEQRFVPVPATEIYKRVKNPPKKVKAGMRFIDETGYLYEAIEPNDKLPGTWWTEAVNKSESTGMWANTHEYILRNLVKSST